MVLITTSIPEGSPAATPVVSWAAAITLPRSISPIWVPSGTPICCTISVVGSSCIMPMILSLPTMPMAMPRSIRVRRIQRTNWVTATRATPMIFPNISSVAFTEDISTSTTRELFSSMTELITIPENRAMNIYRAMPRIMERAI